MTVAIKFIATPSLTLTQPSETAAIMAEGMFYNVTGGYVEVRRCHKATARCTS